MPASVKNKYSEEVINDQHLSLLRQQNALATFGELALRSDDLDEILTKACRLVREALGTDLAKVVELHEDGRSLRIRAGLGWRPGTVGAQLSELLDDSAEAQAIRTGEPMISPDAAESRFSYSPVLIEHGVKAVANVAIIGRHDRPPFGVLEVDSRAPREFTEQEVDFLRSYANLIAAAVDRLRMTSELSAKEAQLREMLNRHDVALETGVIGFFDWNIFTGMVTAGRRFEEFFGIDPGVTQCGLPCSCVLDRIHPDDRPLVRQDIQAALASLADFANEFRVVHDGGEIRWVRLRGHCYKQEDQRPLRYVGAAVDITASKSAQTALRAANEALQAKLGELRIALDKLQEEAAERARIEEALRQSQKMEAVGQLTGGVAHDFNNMLQSVAGSLEMMRHRLAANRVEESLRYLDVARAAVDRAAALTRRLLAFARRQRLDPKPVDPDVLVAGMADLIQRTIGPAVRLEARLRDGAGRILCDPSQLENALMNLCINARDAMPDGGRLLIATRDVRLSAADVLGEEGVTPGDYIEIVVTDTGSGMPPHVRERAFDPFFTTKPQGQGTGLGLSQVFGFVRQSGGTVRLESAPGEGTTVRLRLPRHDGANGRKPGRTAARASALDALPRNGEGTVLLVDDEEAVREAAAARLRDLGYQVVEAGNGREALGVLDRGARPDLLITDVGLPDGMNGRQLAEAARERFPGLPVLFVTGFARTALPGGYTVLAKPFELEALARRVNTILTGAKSGD